MEIIETRSVAGTLALGRRLAERLKAGDCVALVGELGAGKTVLVRGIATGLGLARQGMVSSPTFVLVQEYPCRPTVYHVDLYRLGDCPGELDRLGLDEMLAGGVVLIEWADRAEALPRPRWEIAVRHTGRTRRRFEIRRVE
jgi:tRNA threonylcarbamoyl adenosine modification protein YjeE